MFKDLEQNARRFSKIMGACYEAFIPYNIIFEIKKETTHGVLNQFFIRIEQQKQPNLAVNIDNPQPSFAPYDVIFEVKKETAQGTLIQFVKRIEQDKQPDVAVNIDIPQSTTSAM